MVAEVFNIENVDIRDIDKKEIFALDTNVLFWTHYSQASTPELRVHPYQVTKYPNFVEQLLENGNTLVTTVFNLTELFHIIENSERRIYNTIHGTKISKKAFRAMSVEREKYRQEIELVIEQINSSYEGQIKYVEINDEKLKEFIVSTPNHSCDVFDYLVIDYLKSNDICNFITDDRDFHTIADINVYYAEA